MRRSNEGAVLLTAIILLAVLGVGAASVWSMLHRNLDAVHHQHRLEGVQYLAEAGLEHAIARLQTDRSFTGVKDVPLGDGRYTVVVQRGDGPDSFVLASTGAITDGPLVLREQRLTAQLRLAENGAIRAYTWERQQ